MAADAAIHGSFNPMVYSVKFNFVGWLQLNLDTEFASGSVDGRVRGHDEKGRIYSDCATKLTACFGYVFLRRTTCVNPVGLMGEDNAARFFARRKNRFWPA